MKLNTYVNFIFYFLLRVEKFIKYIFWTKLNNSSRSLITVQEDSIWLFDFIFIFQIQQEVEAQNLSI